MNRFKVTNEILVYEVNGEETKGLAPTILRVESHPIDSNRVILQDPNGARITVVASDLIAAVRNAANAC